MSHETLQECCDEVKAAWLNVLEQAGVMRILTWCVRGLAWLIEKMRKEVA